MTELLRITRSSDAVVCLYVVAVTDAVPAAVDEAQDAAATACRRAQAQARFRVEQAKAETVSPSPRRASPSSLNCNSTSKFEHLGQTVNVLRVENPKVTYLSHKT